MHNVRAYMVIMHILLPHKFTVCVGTACNATKRILKCRLTSRVNRVHTQQQLQKKKQS